MSAKQCECEVCSVTSMPVCVALRKLAEREKGNLLQRVEDIFACATDPNDKAFKYCVLVARIPMGADVAKKFIEWIEEFEGKCFYPTATEVTNMLIEQGVGSC